MSDIELAINYISTLPEYEDEIVKSEVLDILDKAIINQIIGWAIIDGKTTETDVDRENNRYTGTDGKTYRVYANVEYGTYSEMEVVDNEVID